MAARADSGLKAAEKCPAARSAVRRYVHCDLEQELEAGAAYNRRRTAPRRKRLTC